jgi:hypothetical protein
LHAFSVATGIATTIFWPLFDCVTGDYPSIEWDFEGISDQMDCILANGLVKIRVKFLLLGYRMSGKS